MQQAAPAAMAPRKPLSTQPMQQAAPVALAPRKLISTMVRWPSCHSPSLITHSLLEQPAPAPSMAPRIPLKTDAGPVRPSITFSFTLGRFIFDF